MDIKNLIIIAVAFSLVLLIVRYKRATMTPLIFALFVALAWTAYYRYEYIGGNIFLFNQINLYPLVLWTVGLTALQLIHAGLERRYGLVATTVLYLAVLAALETVGYHLLNIRLTTNYTSLLGLGIIHAPLVMKIFYVLAGPVFILLMQLLRIEKSKPRWKIRSIFSNMTSW